MGMAREGTSIMDEATLTPEQQEEAVRIEAALLEAARREVRGMARLLAGCPTEKIFGQTEFTLRDALHRVGAAALETALRERKKGGTKAPACSTPKPASPPSSSAGGRARR